jgi:hypothetical protein
VAALGGSNAGGMAGSGEQIGWDAPGSQVVRELQGPQQCRTYGQLPEPCDAEGFPQLPVRVPLHLLLIFGAASQKRGRALPQGAKGMLVALELGWVTCRVGLGPRLGRWSRSLGWVPDEAR